MAWVNNNKRNARFNPNRKDDRLLLSEITSRRLHKVQKAQDGPADELVSTDLAHVLSMAEDTRVDWLQMALMQAALGKLKASSLYEVLTHRNFAPNEASARKQLKALVVANFHIFSSKQKKALEETAGSWGSESGAGAGDRREARESKEHKGPKDFKDNKSSARDTRSSREAPRRDWQSRSRSFDSRDERRTAAPSHSSSRNPAQQDTRRSPPQRETRRSPSQPREIRRSRSLDAERRRSPNVERRRSRSRSRGRRRPS